MADTLTDHPASIQPVSPEPSSSGSVRIVLYAIIAVAVLALAATGAYLWGANSKDGGSSVSAVDSGFARDMATHHQQAITMAGYARDNAPDTPVKTVAFDIETSQSIEMGEMIGWLQQWGVSRNTDTPMDWMSGHEHEIGPNGLMPGMATPVQMDKLQTLHGKELEIFFLQLMIRHHQGGIEMAQYAADHAQKPYVRILAQKMYNNQSAEIVQMEQLLRQLGGSPLPAPAT
jgi:uncharacterized protein (DUF305 family)